MDRIWVRIGLGLAALLFVANALAQTHVHGYYRKNGTYVAPHYRSSPNSSRLDNWSTKGNVNPYTGKPGTRNPFPEPRPYSSPTYYPRTALPTYRAPSYISPGPRSYEYIGSGIADDARSLQQTDYHYKSPMWGAAATATASEPERVSWYRCDDPDGSYHYSHAPAVGCIFVGSN